MSETNWQLYKEDLEAIGRFIREPTMIWVEAILHGDAVQKMAAVMLTLVYVAGQVTVAVGAAVQTGYCTARLFLSPPEEYESVMRVDLKDAPSSNL